MTKRNENASKVNNSSLANTSAHETGCQSFSEFLAIIQNKFETEKNAKNKAYAFIISRGLLNDYIEFSKHYSTDDSHSDCLSIIGLGITDKN